MVDHFMQFGYCVVKQAFTQEQAREVAGDVWVRLGMDPNDSSTWDKVGFTNADRVLCVRAPHQADYSTLDPRMSLSLVLQPLNLRTHLHLNLDSPLHLGMICVIVGTDQHA